MFFLFLVTLFKTLFVFKQSVGALKRTVENIKDPLFRFFEREVNTGGRLLSDVRRDLQDVLQVCVGERKPTNHHRNMMADLVKGKEYTEIFKVWRNNIE